MIDSIDKSLLKLLQEDSKKPNKYYANQLGLSNTAIPDRSSFLIGHRYLRKWFCYLQYGLLQYITEIIQQTQYTFQQYASQ